MDYRSKIEIEGQVRIVKIRDMMYVHAVLRT